MRFHGVLDDLVGNRTRVRILRALFGYAEKEFSESELQRIASIPQPSVHRNVKRLAEQGVLNRRRVGKANLFSLNKHHVLHRTLSEIFEKERDLVVELEAVILRHLEDLRGVRGVFLFGSIPKGRERPDSDVDVLVVVKDGSRHVVEAKAGELHADIRNKFSNPVSLMVKEESDLRGLRAKPILQEIKDGRQILNRGGIKW